MCEMLGLSFSQPVRITFSFSGLLTGSGWNHDGWGIGCFPDGKAAVVFKEAVAGHDSLLASFLTSYLPLRSATYLAHIRRASRGKVTVSNTHPFNRHLKSLEFLFAHNGTLDKSQLKSGNRYRPVGESDSEKALCYLMSRMEAWKIYPVLKGKHVGYTQQQFSTIRNILLDINQYGSLSCIFSDGTTLFSYRDINGARDLHYLEKRQPLSERELEDEDIKLKVCLDKDSDEYGFVMATSPLSDGEWVSFKPGQLIAVQWGNVVANIF